MLQQSHIFIYTLFSAGGNENNNGSLARGVNRAVWDHDLHRLAVSVEYTALFGVCF